MFNLIYFGVKIVVHNSIIPLFSISILMLSLILVMSCADDGSSLGSRSPITADASSGDGITGDIGNSGI